MLQLGGEAAQIEKGVPATKAATEINPTKPKFFINTRKDPLPTHNKAITPGTTTMAL